jgi:hypothetical protein
MALALAGEQEQAAALLEEASEEERADRDARRELLEAALAAGKADAALAFSAPESSDEYEQLLLAQAAVLSGDTAERDKAIEKLEHLLRSEREEIRNEAAFGRQLASLGTDVPPDMDAQRLLEERAPAFAAILAANALRQEGRDAEAEALLLRHQDDVRVLRELVRAAGQREQWDRVLELSRALMAREPTPLDRMIFVDAVYRAGGRDEAQAELVTLRRDEAVPTEIRRDAYAYSARVALDAFDFELLRRVSVEWFEFVPSDKRAAWNYLHALLRLGRSREAISFADEHQIEPAAIDQAELLAAVLDDHPDPEVAARRIGGLSDRFERPERLEGHFLIAALRVHPEDRLADLRDEIQARLTSFTDRFPDSQIIRSVPIDTTPEGIDAFFKEHIEPGAGHVQETAEKLGWRGADRGARRGRWTAGDRDDDAVGAINAVGLRRSRADETGARISRSRNRALRRLGPRRTRHRRIAAARHLRDDQARLSRCRCRSGHDRRHQEGGRYGLNGSRRVPRHGIRRRE